MEQIWFSGLNMETTTCVGHVLVYAHSLSSQFLSFTIWFKLFATLCLQRQPRAGVLMNCTNYFDVCLVASVTVAAFAGERLTNHETRRDMKWAWQESREDNKTESKYTSVDLLCFGT